MRHDCEVCEHATERIRTLEEKNAILRASNASYRASLARLKDLADTLYSDTERTPG